MQSALAVAEDPRATPEERAEMLMEVARGLQIKRRAAQQLPDAVLLYRRTLALVPPGFNLLAARIRAREGKAHQALPDGGVQALLDAQDCYEAARDNGGNRWLAAARDSLCWPSAPASAGNTAVVVDSGNNRVLLWDLWNVVR